MRARIKKHTKFSNLELSQEPRLKDILRWQFSRRPTPWPRWIESTPSVPISSSLSSPLAITFVNHATCLVQSEGLNLLTDPVWSYRVSPFSWIGPARVKSPGVLLEALPPIHVVVISHNHYDHMDLKSLKALAYQHNPLFIVPLGDRKLLLSQGLKQVYELGWWQTISYENHEITLVPAQHFSGRSFHDRNRSLWGGYVIECRTQRVFFAGDTAYAGHFKSIFERFGPMDLALLPIGAYEPRSIMQSFHMDPWEAVEAHVDLQAKQSVAIHFGTFQLTDEGIDEPVSQLKRALEHRKINLETFKVLKEGETLKIS